MRKTFWLIVAGTLIVVAVLAAVRLRSSRRPAASAAPRSATDSLVLTSLRSRVYRISGGHLIPLPVTPSLSNATRPYGPTISPDQQWIAFTKADDLWIYDVAAGQAHQATHFAQPRTEQLLSIEVLSLGWSSDSRRLLLKVAPGVDECGGECGEQHQRASAQYGFYSYAPGQKSLSPVLLPEEFEFRAWLPDGRFLGIVGRESACRHGSISNCGTLMIAQEGATGRRPLDGFNGSHEQLSISPDGRFAVTSDPDQGDGREDQSQIVKIDLANGEGQWLTPVGELGEYQHPQFSPDGNHVAWLWYARTPNALPQVVLDGNGIFTCGKIAFDFRWLDPRLLAVECGTDLTIIDMAGKPWLRAAIPKS